MSAEILCEHKCEELWQNYLKGSLVNSQSHSLADGQQDGVGSSSDMRVLVDVSVGTVAVHKSCYSAHVGSWAVVATGVRWRSLIVSCVEVTLLGARNVLGTVT